MSVCISRHGEFGSHELDADYVCSWCGVLDEEALIAELNRLRLRRHDRRTTITVNPQVQFGQDRLGVIYDEDVADAVLAAVEPDIRADERRRVREELLAIAEEEDAKLGHVRDFHLSRPSVEELQGTESHDGKYLRALADRIAPKGGDRG